MFDLARALAKLREATRRRRVAEAILELRLAQSRSRANGLHLFANLERVGLSTPSERLRAAASDDKQR